MNFQIILYKNETEIKKSQNWKNTSAWKSDWDGLQTLDIARQLGFNADMKYLNINVIDLQNYKEISISEDTARSSGLFEKLSKIQISITILHGLKWLTRFKLIKKITNDIYSLDIRICEDDILTAWIDAGYQLEWDGKLKNKNLTFKNQNEMLFYNER